jgi:hypothetical protein
MQDRGLGDLDSELAVELQRGESGELRQQQAGPAAGGALRRLRVQLQGQRLAAGGAAGLEVRHRRADAGLGDMRLDQHAQAERRPMARRIAMPAETRLVDGDLLHHHQQDAMGLGQQARPVHAAPHQQHRATLHRDRYAQPPHRLLHLEPGALGVDHRGAPEDQVAGGADGHQRLPIGPVDGRADRAGWQRD